MFETYFRIGLHHILSFGAWDHLLFLLSLACIYTFKDWKQVLILVTAFTIGHSVTLVLSTLNIIKIPGKWIEFFIPVTIGITAIINTFSKKASPGKYRFQYFLAAFFGLVHGLGFANGLKSLLGRSQSILVPLLGFNVGIEVAQIAVVFIILLITAILVGLFKASQREWVLFLSGGAFITALMMAVERWPM